MLPLRFPWVWWGLGWLLVAGVTAASLLPGHWVATLALRDKALHAGSYFLLMIWFAGLYRRERHLWIALLLLGLGFALDLAQGASRTRSFELADVAANAGGILVGLVLARFVFEGWCRRIERLFGFS
jgi:VanZ family protein